MAPEAEMRAAARKRFQEFASDPVSATMLVQRIAEGETLTDICRSLEVPYALVAQWIVEDAERVREYDAALALWADAEAQRCIGIADDTEGAVDPVAVSAAKLRITTRMSLAGKWDRRRYGEHTKVEHSGSVTSLIQVLSSLPGPHERDVTPAATLPAIAMPSLTVTAHEEI